MKKCNGKIKNFPSGPVIKTLPSNPRDVGLLPGQGVKSPHVSWQKEKNKTIQKLHCNKFNKDFKNGPHQEMLQKKKKRKKSTSLRAGYSTGGKIAENQRLSLYPKGI